MEHNNIQTFTDEELGEVRVVMIDGEPWFVAADVCRILEIDKTQTRRLNNDEKGLYSIQTLGGEQRTVIVNEPGLYRLIFSSRKPEARKFQHWVYHEVLPSIRKTGSYSINAQPAQNTKSARRDAQVKMACVYVLLMSNGIVKIGYSGQLRRRVAKLEKKIGLTVSKIHFTPFTSREIARFVEWVSQKNFSSRKVEGEFFSVDFNEACAVIDEFFAKAVRSFSSVKKLECRDVLIFTSTAEFDEQKKIAAPKTNLISGESPC